MFKLDHQEWVAYRVEFQKRLTDIADEIVAEAMQDAGADVDWDDV